MEKIIFQLIEKNEFTLKINTELKNFELISHLLTFHNIKFETWTPEGEMVLENSTLGFSQNCNFLEIYLLVQILKDYGLEFVYLTRKEEAEVSIGTYITQVENQAKYAFAEPISVAKFLEIHPKSSMNDVISNHFTCLEYNEEEDDYEEDYDDYDEHDDYDDYDRGDYNDYDRDTFYALTDGQYGDHDDFREGGGDIDDVYTWLGRD